MSVESDLRRTLPAERWFGGKSRTIRSVEIADRAPSAGDLPLVGKSSRSHSSDYRKNDSGTAFQIPIAGVKEILDHGK